MNTFNFTLNKSQYHYRTLYQILSPKWDNCLNIILALLEQKIEQLNQTAKQDLQEKTDLRVWSWWYPSRWCCWWWMINRTFFWPVDVLYRITNSIWILIIMIIIMIKLIIIIVIKK
jgi:membrane protein insertase Oxa1/YidC/SpoIIIJ